MTEPEKIKYDLMCCLVLGGNESEKHEAMRNALMYINQLERDNERSLNSYDAAMCEAADSAAMVQRWICAKDQLPEKGKAVLVAFADGYVTIGTLWEDCWIIPYTDFDEPVAKGTWWMPLPEPPEVTKP